MKYELLDKSGCPIYVIDIEKIGEYDNLKTHVDFKIWEVESWSTTADTTKIGNKHFVANVYFKWDWCTHWNFYGMDYDPENKDNDINPAYYHICGSFFMERWMVMFAFVRTVMLEVLGDRTNDYLDSDKELDKMLLKDYTIRKEE